MAKLIQYRCDGDGLHDAASSGPCDATEEMPVGQFPTGWRTLSFEVRSFGSKPSKGDRADKALYLHLCADCKALSAKALEHSMQELLAK